MNPIFIVVEYSSQDWIEEDYDEGINILYAGLDKEFAIDVFRKHYNAIFVNKLVLEVWRNDQRINSCHYLSDMEDI